VSQGRTVGLRVQWTYDITEECQSKSHRSGEKSVKIWTDKKTSSKILSPTPQIECYHVTVGL